MKKIAEYRTPDGYFDADVNITKAEWLEIISAPAIKDKTYLDVLTKFLRQNEHRSTCKALGKKHECSYSYFNVAIMNFGKHVKEKLGRFYIENLEGKESFWNIPMIGRNTKEGFEWTLRKELVDALQEYLILDLIARYKKLVSQPSLSLDKEKYKWELLTAAKGKSTLEILGELTRPNVNLIDAPRAGFAIKHMLTEDTEALESSFNELLNSERSFTENYAAFSAIIKPVAESKYHFVFPDERTAAAFLTCAKPDTYTFYMDKVYQEYCRYLGVESKSAGNKYVHYLKLVSRISQMANNDKELRYFLMEQTKGNQWSDLLVGQDILWEMQQRMIVEEPRFGYTWTAFYEELADKLSGYSDHQQELLQKIRNAYDAAGQTMARLTMEGEEVVAVDPFTIYGMFNKREEHDRRYELADKFKELFGISADTPLRFSGIPVLNPLSAAFYSFESGDKLQHIRNIWDFFKAAIAYSQSIVSETREAFISAYDTVREQPRIKWNLTMALFWMRPHAYISLDTNNRDFLTSGNALSERATSEIAAIIAKKNKIPTGEEYLRICDIVKEEIATGACPYADFLDFSRHAWESVKQTENDDEAGEIDETPEEMNTLNESTDLTETPVEQEEVFDLYTKGDFLKEVYMSEEMYDKLESILSIKKNLILRGSPGVGKTFAAKRLAFSIMGKKDTNRVQLIQFHQSYSYEDFIMGYRPNDSGGFELRPGVFYKFCKKAERDPEHNYYFIIDEINRGNLSKIFGELFMLVEATNREEKLHLAYREELFSVPKNLYIIGMLNTADRSLAMIDYALRRRFSFVEMEPAIDKLMEVKGITKDSKLGRLLDEVKNLNEEIKEDPSLGSGFRIGHSYFCNDDAVSDVHLANVVEYEIIPMLEEYWFDNPAKAGEWSGRLREAIK